MLRARVLVPGIAVISAAVVFGFSNPATADIYLCELNAQEFCLFENNEFNEGTTHNCRQWFTDDSNYTGNNWYDCAERETTGDGLDDETSSLINTFNFTTARICQHDNYGGACSNFGPNEFDAVLSGNNVGDNRASSHNLL